MKVRRIDFSPDEWLAGAFALRADQRGCYVTLIMLIYSHGGPILDDERSLAHACNVTVEKWRTVRSVLIDKGKIIVTSDGRLTNRRCETELKKALNRTEKARENGEKGGKISGISRKKPTCVSSNANALAEADASSADETNHQPSTINPCSPLSAYAFEGAVIRLNHPDYDRWAKTYHAIPDLAAELACIDAWLANRPKRQTGWFHAVQSMLNKRHQERLSSRPPVKRRRPQAADVMPEIQP